MADLAELLEATLDSLPEGIAVLGEDYHVVLWNRAAAAITGYTALEIVGRAAPNALKPLLECCGSHEESETGYCRAIGHGTLLHARHKLGHDVSSMARFLPLHDPSGMGRVALLRWFDDVSHPILPGHTAHLPALRRSSGHMQG